MRDKQRRYRSRRGVRLVAKSDVAGAVHRTLAGQRSPATCRMEQVAEWFAESILAGRVVHLFGTGHSRIMVEEMWPRYGSFPGFNPIVELSLTYHNNVTGANGQRQAMFLENVSGLAERILRNFNLDEKDCALIVSSGGCNIVPIEMAELFQQKKIKTVALITKDIQQKVKAKELMGKN